MGVARQLRRVTKALIPERQKYLLQIPVRRLHVLRSHSSQSFHQPVLRSFERALNPVYTDKASLFQIAPRGIHHRDAPEQQQSQIGRALRELNIEWIAAYSPQAKGRDTDAAPYGGRGMRKVVVAGIVIGAIAIGAILWTRMEKAGSQETLRGVEVVRVTRRDIGTTVKATVVIKPMVH
jgi:hypothetical protein